MTNGRIVILRMGQKKWSSDSNLSNF